MCKNLGDAWNQRELKWALGPLTFNPKKRYRVYTVLYLCVVIRQVWQMAILGR